MIESGVLDNMNNLIIHNLKIRVYFLLIILFIVVVVVGASVNLDSKALEKDAVQQIENFKYSYEYNMVKNVTLADANVLGAQSDDKAGSIPVLVYHGINDNKNGTSVTQENFKDQIFALKNAGYRALSIKEFYEYITNKQPAPPNSILITFDDGAKDSFYPSDPILNAVDFKATNFIITDFAQHEHTDYYLAANEIEKMISTGRWDVQAHTHDGHKEVDINDSGDKAYFFSNRMWLPEQRRLETLEEYDARIAADMTQAKTIIENVFGQESIGFAYPFGDFGIYQKAVPEARRYVLDNTRENYKLAFYQYWEDSEFSFSQNYPDENNFLVKRITLRSDWNGQDLLNYLEKGKAKSLPYNDDLESDKGWVTTWGNTIFEEDRMILKTDDGSNGASVYLDGTYNWKDYAFSADIGINQSESISMIGAYQDRNTYYSCDFSEGYISLRHKFGGTITKLVEIPNSSRIERVGIAFKEGKL